MTRRAVDANRRAEKSNLIKFILFNTVILSHA